MRISRLTTIVLLIAPLTACAGVSISSTQKGGTSKCPPADTVANWNSDLQGPLAVLLDGADVSQQFTVNNAARTATASMETTVGQHQMQASGTFSCWYCSSGSTALSASDNFTVSCSKGK